MLVRQWGGWWVDVLSDGLSDDSLHDLLDDSLSGLLDGVLDGWIEQSATARVLGMGQCAIGGW